MINFIEILPSIEDYYVTTLMYEECPVTFLYNIENKLVIREWITKLDGNDVFLIFECEKYIMRQYLQSEISYSVVIESSIGNIYCRVVEDSDKNVLESSIVTFKDIPERLIPAPDAIYEEGESNSYNLAFETFNLIGAISPYDQFYEASGEADEFKMLSLHVLTGDHVDHGFIDSDVLYSLLGHYNEFYKETSLDHVYGTDRRGYSEPTDENERTVYRSITTTRSAIPQAASYNLFMKESDIDSEEIEDNHFEAVTKSMFDIMAYAGNETLFNDIQSQASEYTLSSYKSLLSFLDKEEVELDTTYYKHSQETKILRSSVRRNYVSKAIRKLRKRVKPTLQELELFGKFIQINTDTKSYKFRDINELHSSGHFSGQVRNLVDQILLSRTYKIVVQRKTSINITGRASIKDIIVGYFPLDIRVAAQEEE